MGRVWETPLLTLRKEAGFPALMGLVFGLFHWRNSQ